MRFLVRTLITALLASPEGRQAIQKAWEKLNTPENRAKAKEVFDQVKEKRGAGKTSTPSA